MLYGRHFYSAEITWQHIVSQCACYLHYFIPVLGENGFSPSISCRPRRGWLFICNRYFFAKVCSLTLKTSPVCVFIFLRTSRVKALPHKRSVTFEIIRFIQAHYSTALPVQMASVPSLLFLFSAAANPLQIDP